MTPPAATTSVLAWARSDLSPIAAAGRCNYYAVPLDVLENAGELAEWARRAIDVAKRVAR